MAPTATFPLHGYERFFAMTPGTSAKLAHVMTLRGDMTTLLTHLPAAILAVFNHHPKMRVMLMPGVSPQRVMVCPPFVDVTELKGVYTITWREKEEESNEWMTYVQDECAVAVDREHDLPFSVRVFADKTSQRFARVMLFSDHYMSDQASGAIVLNAILQHAALASEGKLAATSALPVRPSLYECQHPVHPWLGILNEAVAKWVIEPLFNFDHSGFVPQLPVDTTTQQDYAGKPPTPINPSMALFATGSASCMQKALAKCEAEGVSLQGALTAATMLAFGLTKSHGRLVGEEPIVVKTDVSCDMRKEVSPTFSEDVVGLYSTAGNLVFTSSEGVLPSANFWALARKADEELRAMLHGHELKVQSMYVHETLNAESLECSLQVKHSVLSDATIANGGVYPHAHEVTLRNASGATSTLHVESLHVYNSLPSLSSACMLFLSGVSSFNYSMMSKLEGRVAQELFHWYVQCVEHLGEFGTNDTLVQASAKLEQCPLSSTASAVVQPLPTQQQQSAQV